MMKLSVCFCLINLPFCFLYAVANGTIFLRLCSISLYIDIHFLYLYFDRHLDFFFQVLDTAEKKYTHADIPSIIFF